VKSISLTTSEGPATVGDGEGRVRIRDLLEGDPDRHDGRAEGKLPGSAEWKVFRPYDRFEVEKNSKFQLDVPADASYICYYK
jgi:uncharacterized protein YaiE (UPF0345 family)